MRHSTGTPTKAEAARMDAIKEAGICLACYQHGYKQPAHVEIHHLLSGNKRRGHGFTVGLCVWHHRGLPPCGWDSAQAEYELGPSLARGSKPFRAMFGTDDELLSIQNEMIGQGENLW